MMNIIVMVYAVLLKSTCITDTLIYFEKIPYPKNCHINNNQPLCECVSSSIQKYNLSIKVTFKF